MQLIGLTFCLFGLGIYLCLPLICIGIVFRWSDLVTQIAANLAHPAWVNKLLRVRFLLPVAILGAFAVIISKYMERAAAEGRYPTVFEAVINPIWIVICLSGFWLARNFFDGSARLKRGFIAIGLISYVLLAGWLTLLPLAFMEQSLTLFFYLSPLNFLFGFTFLRTSTGEPPNGRRPIKYIIRDVAIIYTIIFLGFAFMSTIKID